MQVSSLVILSAALLSVRLYNDDVCTCVGFKTNVNILTLKILNIETEYL